MSIFTEQLMQIIGLLTYLVSLGVYGYLLYIILKYLPQKLILAPKVTVQLLLGPIIAFIVVLGAIEYAPAMIASSVARGYAKSMPVFLGVAGDVADGIVYYGNEEYDNGASFAAQPMPTPVFSVRETERLGETTNESNNYTVQAGDSLVTIANANGLTPAELATANGITDGRISVGQIITIPEPCTYTVNGEVIPCPPIP